MILNLKNSFVSNFSILKPKLFTETINNGFPRNYLYTNPSLKWISSYERKKTLNGPLNFNLYKGKQHFHTNPVLNYSSNQRKLLETLTHGNYTNSYRNYGKQTFYLQNPFKWVSNNVTFEQTKKYWDNSLDKEEFIQGSKFAVVSILQEIKNNNFKALKGLLAKTELTRLRHEVETDWTDELRRNVGISFDNILTLAIRNVRTQQIVHNKYLDIEVAVVASVPGPAEQQEEPSQVYVIHATFCRDYTPGRLPDWVVTNFKLHMKPWQTFMN